MKKQYTRNKNLFKKVFAFPSERIKCPACGGHFQRLKTEVWKKICQECWHWNRALSHIDAMSQHLKRLRS